MGVAQQLCTSCNFHNSSHATYCAQCGGQLTGPIGSDLKSTSSILRRIVPLLLVLLAILHQDFWWWNSVDPLVFGFIPIGLAYHVGVSLVAACLWALAVKYCWPKDVDIVDSTVGGASSSTIREVRR